MKEITVLQTTNSMGCVGNLVWSSNEKKLRKVDLWGFESICAGWNVVRTYRYIKYQATSVVVCDKHLEQSLLWRLARMIMSEFWVNFSNETWSVWFQWMPKTLKRRFKSIGQKFSSSLSRCAYQLHQPIGVEPRLETQLPNITCATCSCIVQVDAQ